jgi:PAS domain S-box-containing protein
MNRILDFVKNKFSFGYEKEIRLSLLFFILFLVLLNFGTLFLLTKAKLALKEENNLRLKSFASQFSLFWKTSSDLKKLKNELSDLASGSNIQNVILVNQKREVIFSLYPDDVVGEKENHKIDSSSTFLVNSYSEDPGKLSRRFVYPFYDERTKQNLLLIVQAEARVLYALEKLSTLDSVLRGIGIFCALGFSFIFIKKILRPYTMMKEKAAEAKITPERNSPDSDIVVEIFTRTIKELKKKETILKDLYQVTKQDAVRLAQFNEYILKSISSGVIICDNSGKIIRFNDPAKEIFSSSADLVLNHNYEEVFKEYVKLSELVEETLIAEKEHRVEEMELPGREGKNIWLGVSTSLIKNEENETLGILVLITDITPLKNLQKELVFKEKMAILGETSAGLAHELRNSMAAILGYGKLLKKILPGDDSSNEIIDGIINESLQTETMLQRYLNITKPLEIVPERFNLGPIIQDALKMVKESAPNVVFESKLPPTLPAIYGDPLLLKQTFQNLFQNSIEAMPQGGKLSVSLEPKKDFIEISIEDTGCGIPQENLGKIFNPFFSSKEKGMGLGLSLVKKIITSHQGSIEVESEVGKGTIFRIYLPMELQSPTEEKTKREQRAKV